MRLVQWSTSAKQSFEDALDFIARDNPGNARLVQERILKTLRNLEEFSLGLPAPKGYFKLYIQKTSHFVVYDVQANGNVMLLAFIHAARDWDRIDWEALG
jgi:plasmid stabilization system protein ParE